MEQSSANATIMNVKKNRGQCHTAKTYTRRRVENSWRISVLMLARVNVYVYVYIYVCVSVSFLYYVAVNVNVHQSLDK